MRPRVLKRRLIAAATAGFVGVILLTNANAKADPLDATTITDAPDVCSALVKTPTEMGVENEVAALHLQGLSGDQAGEIVGRAVVGWCPDQMPEVQAFAAKWGTAKKVLA
jgi:hypothetical protein